MGHRSRKLAVRRNVGSRLQLQQPHGLTERKHTGKWGVLTAAEKRAPTEGGSAIAVTSASKIPLTTVQVRFFFFLRNYNV